MKLIAEFKKQIEQLSDLKYVWFTSFNISIEFIETYLLPAVLDMETPKNRLDYEYFQLALIEKNIDFRVFCDKRFMMQGNQNKRTAIPVHGISPARIESFSKDSLFHPKVVYLEDVNGKKIVGAGSANLTIGGWGRNQEVFCYYEVGTLEQYNSVKVFFQKLFENVGVECPLPIRRSFSGNEGWSFVHSFQQETFLKQLFADVNTNHLAVWSPYFPKDLAGYIRNLKQTTGRNNLKIALVPDRVDGKYIRTPWSDELASLLKDQDVAFYDNPTKRHDNVELCHAKVWKVSGKVAIGSWNFTGPGSNSLIDDDPVQDSSNNIEAGFLINDTHSWKDVVGEPVKLDPSDFASTALLNEENLKVPEDLPFDIRVSYDWREQRYDFAGTWLQGDIDNKYSIKVPSVAKEIQLLWLAREKTLQITTLLITNPMELLAEHRFEVIHNKKVIYRGLITETGLSFRRSQAFESLNELLAAVIFDVSTAPGDPIPFRIPAKENGDFPEDDLGEEGQGTMTQKYADISLFRLFRATNKYADDINSLKNMDELNQKVFSRPGCLVELIEKTMEKIKAPQPSVFNWFLAQEVNVLCKLADKKRRNLGNSDNSLPKLRWEELTVPLPRLPKGIQKPYIKLIQKECGYVRT